MYYELKSRRWEKNLRLPFKWKLEEFPPAHLQVRRAATLVAWCEYFDVERPVKRKTYWFDEDSSTRHHYTYPSKNARLMQRLGLQCVSCGEHASYYALVRSMGKCMVWALTRDGVPFTLDHHMPRALGGSNRSSNLRVMCDVCNQKKGCAHPEQ